MLISIPPVIIEGETKTTLFLVCVSTSRTLRCPNAGRNCWQNGNIFVVDLTMSITVLASHLTG